MKHIGSLSLMLMILLGISVCYAPAWADTQPAPQDGKIFTNDDLSPARGPSVTKLPVKGLAERIDEIEAKDAKRSQKKEQEYWCRQASAFRKKIDRAKDDLTDAERQKGKSARSKIAKAKKTLKYTEKDLADLEDEAHRKGVPPGWLRCQFE